MTTVREPQVTFDGAEPRRLAAFWCEVLGHVLPPPPDGCASREEADRRLVALGAVRVRLLLADGVDGSCPVMQDVEGDEPCLD